ncbi:MAG: RNA polymerase sigma factor [Myxococcota bacterium]|nr:RNA polymerase sigma factor [Myxococcota bacterium]
MLARLLTDNELLRRYEQGEEAAFEQLYTRHRRRLWGMARKIGRDIQQAEDILVEAMAAVAVQARRGRIQGSFIGYALTAVHHRGLHVIERSNERKARSTLPLTLTLVSGGPTPEEHAIRQTIRNDVADALEALPRDTGTAVYLVDCQGLSYKEAALALSCSETTIKRRLRSGRLELAERLQHLAPQRETGPGTG